MSSFLFHFGLFWNIKNVITFWEEMNNALNNKDSINYCELEKSAYY